MNKIVHIMPLSAFTPNFIDFVSKKFGLTNHRFFVGGAFDKLKVEENQHVTLLKKEPLSLFKLLVELYKADRIILHSCTNIIITILFFLQPWLLKKCYWVVWGGDLYSYKLDKKNLKWHITQFFRRPVIRQMGHMATYVKGDVRLARQWYGAKGKYCECMMYPNIIYKDYGIQIKEHEEINIQVGNSADPCNNHLQILEILKTYKDKNIKIYVPLSYGDEDEAKKVASFGKEIFGEKFIPLTEFMAFEDYLDFLSKIDIAIFNHERQQGMGNIVNLLGSGKKVYMRSDITPWEFFAENDIEVFDINYFDLKPIDKTSRIKNHDKILNYFSEKTLYNQWQKIFND